MKTKTKSILCSELTRAASIAGLSVALLAGAGAAMAAGTGDLAHGGRLYDKWYGEADAAKPEQSHAMYPADKKYAKKAGANWRCKECHGWDYLGKNGAYSKGKHSTGIKGIEGKRGADPQSIVALLKGKHGFDGKLSDADLLSLGRFVSRGQVDMDPYIDRATKKSKGNAAKGADYYHTICASCHGKDGREINFKNEKKPEYVGTVSNANPWEVFHKLMNGQPGQLMPALRALDHQVAADILAYAQSLPKK